MEHSKQELEEELSHEQNILRLRRRNLRMLEIQEASYGLDVPIHIRTQIVELTNQIKNHEKRIDHLQTLLAEGDISLAEVEYRMILAETWDTLTGRPTVVGLTRLDFTRLRLHIAPERSKELELEIRRLLAYDTVIWFEEHKLDKLTHPDFHRFIAWVCGNSEITLSKLLPSEALALVWKLIMLDPEIALDFIIKYSYKRPIDAIRLYMLFFRRTFTGTEDERRVSALMLSKVGPRDISAERKAFIREEMDELFPD